MAFLSQAHKISHTILRYTLSVSIILLAPPQIGGVTDRNLLCDNLEVNIQHQGAAGLVPSEAVRKGSVPRLSPRLRRALFSLCFFTWISPTCAYFWIHISPFYTDTSYTGLELTRRTSVKTVDIWGGGGSPTSTHNAAHL